MSRLKSICILKPTFQFEIIVLLTFIFIFAFNNGTYSQSQTLKPQYKSWVKLQAEKKKVKSYIHKVDETGVYFLNRNYKPEEEQYEFYGFDEIKSIGIKKKGKFLKSILIGGLVGASIGVASGYISGDDPPRNSGWFCIFCPRSLTTEQKATNRGIGF